jgi:hypothetical protein
VSGEVTPKDAHKIGLETARRMWGANYEVVVTTHLNTDRGNKERSPTIPLCGIKRGNGATPHGVTPYLHRVYFLMGLPQKGTAVFFRNRRTGSSL